ncbi:MAG: hypothetical protein RIS88_2488 [Pseudomonadota bacterium]|jgi:hypothetical protein
MIKPLLFVGSLLCAGTASAACLATALGGTCGTATKYEVNVQSVALCQDSSCSSPVTVGSSAQSFDIASAAVGSAIGSYANFDSVTAGNYTHIQVIASRSFTISGTATGCSAVTSQTLSVPNTNPGGTLDAAMAALGITWYDSPTKSQLKIITALSSPLTISRTASMPNVSVRFGTSQGLMCIATVPYPSPPDISIVVQ